MGSLVRAQDNGFTGYATATVSRDGIEMRTFGYRDAERALPYDTLTIQPIGSVSKVIIGLAIMKARELGLVELDADINQYLDFEVNNPNIKGGQPITLRHLATHTSGILDNEKLYFQAYQNGTKSPYSLKDFIGSYFHREGSRFSKGNFGKHQPGMVYNYSNMGAALAAYVVERASQMPFERFTEIYIFQPIGLKQSHWTYQDTHREQYAQLYDERDKPLEVYSLATYPEGGLRTNILELASILRLLMSGYSGQDTILTKESWLIFFKKNFYGQNAIEGINPKEPDTGIFVVHAKSGAIGHTGSDPGLCAFMFFEPGSMKGKVFMANEDLIPQNLDAFRAIWENL